MEKLVTIAIPIYKRLEYLPQVLNIFALQDYPNIDLLVSDNGMNGTIVPEIVTKYYPKPYRFRQNPSTVNVSIHYNQLIQNACGDYFVVLADDDEISPNYASDLVSLLEKNPQASVALAVQESIDEAGNLITRSGDTVPEILSGPDFIRSIWGTPKYGFHSLSTYMAKTERLLASGGYPPFWAAQGDEDALIVRMCLDNFVIFSTRSTFRKRYCESTDQHSLAIEDLARGLRDFLKFFDTDPRILAYAASHPVEWSELKGHLVKNAWSTYYLRWANIYRTRLPFMKWAFASFALPFIPSYYKAVASTLISETLAHIKRAFPHAYEAYLAVKTKYRKPA